MFFAQSCGHAKFQVWILEIRLFEKKLKKGPGPLKCSFVFCLRLARKKWMYACDKMALLTPFMAFLNG